MAQLRTRFGHVSAERVLSGPGLENLYRAIAEIDGVDAPARAPREISAAAAAGDALCAATLDMFCAMLGTVAGNLALTFCARGGVYIGGGIVPRFPEYLARSEFRVRFEAGGRYHTYLHDIPVNIILRPDATFLGLKALITDGLAAIAVTNGPVPL